ncbi:Holliday junction DNA helicase RuvB [Metamycoplasma arthritidis]|uniref:Holliday junction branch migration complex subunit RuvB n=1 Tax=Metamycoplasma arthritidis (strain 158L3-1) TaxID=243272 RepID=B3PMK4_META1|nr:Holliday junction branch migration DNA helicase RuvB [Metamycoplasma arthritidis]ACF07256.1 Holliday junction DNA helicase RuvB [Metamycoplasma arthritidis 158L3-1]VEU78779.1 Holliday junction DNA helicase RuvB [Metamycoplasma arthritidis]
MKLAEFRVKSFSDFIGQEKITKTLKVMIASASKLKRPIDHLLFYGPPGLGKTSLAKIIATETKRNIVYAQGPLLEKKSDILTLLNSIKENDIIFIDEVHGINHNLEELLYSALEDGVVDIPLGVEGDRRIMRMKLKSFSLIAATTKFNLLSQPLKDRFGFIGKLTPYTDEEIIKIITNSAARNNIPIDEKAIKKIAEHSRQTPRVANNLLKRVYDFAVYEKKDLITEKLVKKAFKFIGIFQYGLVYSQIEYLRVLHQVFNDSFGSLDAISGIISDEKSTIINEIEPLLLVYKLIEKSSRGRKITANGIRYLEANLTQ